MSGALILDDLAVFVRRFVVLTAEQADACALFVAHTHAFEAAETTPYMAVTSAEKRSGKSRLLEVCELLVREPIQTMNISEAALYRAIEKLKPTLLLDEIDAIFSPKAREKEDLRSMLNAGWRPGAVALRMGGAQNRTLESFSVFCPKMFAGIGELPDTIADRSIRIRLQRRTRQELIERFHRRVVTPEGELLRDRVADWCTPQIDELHSIRPPLPEQLDDRAQDYWEPLLAIAELAGEDWSDRARTAALVLSAGDNREDDSIRARLIADVYQLHTSTGVGRWKTADLIAELSKIEESPWGDWKLGKPISAQALSKLLKPHAIRTMSVKVEGETVRGYKVEQFADAFARVLGVTGVTPVTSRSPWEAASNTGNAGNAPYGNGPHHGQLSAEEEELERLAERARAFQDVDEEEIERLAERVRQESPS